MSTRANPMAGRYFNDPSIAAAVSNLAGAFAPPSAEEYLLAEQVKGERTTNAALADLYGMANGNPDILGGIISGGWNPTQGFEAMRGSLANERYATDVGASTALATNEADNERALKEAILGGVMDPMGRQSVDEQMLNAILPGAGLPGITAAQPVAPTETQMIAQIMAEQSPEDQRALLDPSTVQTLGPDGQPIITPEMDAIGMEAYNNPGSQAAPIAITFERNGVRTGGFIKNGRYEDAAGNPLTPEEAGTAAEVGKPVGTNSELGITNSNRTAFNAIQAITTESDMLIDSLIMEIEGQAGAAGLAGTVQNVGQNILQVGRELGAAFGGDPNAIITPNDLAALGLPEGPYDPTFARLRSGMLQLAYLNAQRDNPSGEVSRFALERQIEALGQGLLANDQSILAALSMNKEANARKRAASKALLGEEVVPPAASAPAGAIDGLTEEDLQYLGAP